MTAVTEFSFNDIFRFNFLTAPRNVDRGLLVTDDLPASLSMTSMVKWSGSNLRGAALMTISVRIEWRKFVTVDHETIKLCKGHCMICMSLDHDMSLDHMTVSTSVISQQ